MSYDTHMLLALANLAACGGVFVLCIQRMALMDKHTTKFTWRANYSILLTCSVASGFSPIFFSEWPGIGSVAITTAFLVILLTSSAWRNGVPWYARRYRHERRSSK